jgi:rod shape-determining protein MreB and related proteins
VLVSVSSCTTPIERRAVRDAAKRAGASSVQLIEHVIAAALGADLPIHEPVGTFVLDVGAGATEAALLSLGCVVSSSSVRSGSSAVDLAIKGVMRRQYGMIITDRTAEEIKLAVSSVPGGSDTLIEARGQMALDGSTMTAILERSEVQSVVDAYVEQSIEAVRTCLTGVSPELSQDMIARGLYLVGGGALLGGLAERLAKEFAVPVYVMDQPDHAVVMGAAKCLEDQESLRRLFVGTNS